MREDAESIKVFYCYDRKDKKLKEKLGTHLGVLKKTYPIVMFSDIEEILPGENLEEEIDKLFSTSDIILALVSADFSVQTFITWECKKLLKGRKKERYVLFPLSCALVHGNKHH